MNIPILYSFRRCPYAIRARLALYYSKINYEHREILLKNRPNKLYEISPKGTVPVLDLLNGEVIDESFDIMKWAISMDSSETLFNRGRQKQIDMILLNDMQFKKWLDKYKYHVRYPEDSMEFYRENCKQILDQYEDHLKNFTYLLDNEISLADFAILPFVRQFANVDIKWYNDSYSYLSSWMNKLMDFDIFIQIMKKFEVWDENKRGEVVMFEK
ncbi:MAG: glutathione S-transferase N-terminal domain-containing protein [Candidatus Neomarinimicrobiota bacterium]|tara:strand:- start:2024 stop:2665 length:642 start_codon:yes stop_codon:yes gene_type:complete